MESKRHTILITKTKSGLSAQVKEAKGVTTTGRNEQELKSNIIEAIDAFYAPYVFSLKMSYQYV